MLMKSIVTSLSVSAILFSVIHENVNGEVHNSEKNNNDSNKVSEVKNEAIKVPASHVDDRLVGSLDNNSNQKAQSEEDKLLLEEIYGDVNASPFDELEDPVHDDLSEIPNDQTDSKKFRWNKLKQYQYEIPTTIDKDYNQLVKEGNLNIDYDQYNAFLAEAYPQDFVPVGPNDRIDNVKFQDYLLYKAELEKSPSYSKIASAQNNTSDKAESQHRTVTTVEDSDIQSTRLKDSASHQTGVNDRLRDVIAPDSTAQQPSTNKKDVATNSKTSVTTDVKKDPMVKKVVNNKRFIDTLTEKATMPVRTEVALDTKVGQKVTNGKNMNKTQTNSQQNIKSEPKKLKQLPQTGNTHSHALTTMGILLFIGITLVMWCLYSNKKSNI